MEGKWKDRIIHMGRKAQGRGMEHVALIGKKCVWLRSAALLLRRSTRKVLVGIGDGRRKRISNYLSCLFDAIFNEIIFNINESTNKCLVRPLDPSVVTAEGVS